MANVIYRINTQVEDYLGLKSKKMIQLNITINETWYREWLMRNWRPPDIERVIRVPAARINRITVLGEVDLIFNQSSSWKPKAISDLSDERFKKLKIYIDPSEDWHLWTEQKPESVNFTWEVREFNDKRMRIKLNFSDPLSVSPNLRYDLLQIHLPDALTLFDHFSSEKRQLVH